MFAVLFNKERRCGPSPPGLDGRSRFRNAQEANCPERFRPSPAFRRKRVSNQPAVEWTEMPIDKMS